MFESDDFDLDEDFLNDISKKEEEYYSQQIESERDQSTKRLQTEPLQLDLLSDITFDDEPDFARVTTKSIEPSHTPVERSNMILERQNLFKNFKTNIGETSQTQDETKTSNLIESTGKNSGISWQSECTENMEISRKTLALEILRKGCQSSDKNHNDETNSNSSERRSSPLSPLSLNGERTSRINNINEETRRKNLLEIFKRPTSKSCQTPAKFNEKNKTKVPSRDRSIAAPRMTLIRKFPGPAGLLPDSFDTNVDYPNFFNRSDDCNIEISDDHEDSGISEYCSQDTDRLFTVGAWRLMLDDLPKDFLKGHEIATIKRQARSNSRVSFLAGVIQRIDHSVQNPRLVLKDLSDSIEGTMHSDIPLAHPNIFEPGVVVLLRNTGLLEFQSSPNFPSLQFHVMIATKNILAVYSEKSRLVTSPWMETLGTVDRSGRTSRATTKCFENNADTQLNVGETETPRYSMIAVNNIDLRDFEDDENDTKLARFNNDETTDSKVASSFAKFSSKIETNIVPTDKSVTVGERKRKISSLEDEPISTKASYKIAKECSSDEQIETRPAKCSIAMENKIRPKNIVSVKSRLLKFRSKDALTPPIREEATVEKLFSSIKHDDIATDDSREENNSKTRSFADHLFDSDNDTEDEILSQLDVESIITRYNSAT